MSTATTYLRALLHDTCKCLKRCNFKVHHVPFPLRRDSPQKLPSGHSGSLYRYCPPSPLSSACHVHGGAPCPSAGRERYVLLRGVEAGLVLQEQEEVGGSEWAERRLEVLEQGVTVALDDCAPLGHRRHGVAFPAPSWPALPGLSAVSLSPLSPWRLVGIAQSCHLMSAVRMLVQTWVCEQG